MLTNRSLCRAAHSPSRGGFTLVELLVVIGIIAILAGVALGPITNGIKKAQQSSGVQEAHAIGLAMYSFANDNSQTYPDTGNPGVPVGNAAVGAAAVAQPLLAGGYVSDPTIFGLSGDTSGTYAKVSSTTNTSTTITAAQISWDFLGNSGKGATSTQYSYMPLLWSTCTGGTAPNLGAAAGAIMYAIPALTNPFSTAGVAVFYVNNSAAFVTESNQGGTLESVIVPAAQNLGGPTTAYVALPGT